MNSGPYWLGAALIGLGLVANTGTGVAAPCAGMAFGVDFAASYTCNSLGGVPDVPAPLGGITFLDNDTILIGGAANGAGGVIRQIDVVRDINGHITGFSGTSSPYAAAANIDGGLSFGPGGVLFYTGYSNNILGQIKPGSVGPDKVINLSGLPGTAVGSSVGTLAFVPAGFAGAGEFKIASYSTGQWYTGTLTPDGSGTFDLSVTLETVIPGGPEGIVYVDGINAGFGVDSILVSEYSFGSVGVYDLDANGDPTGTRRTFLSGLSGAEGAIIDPLTGDFLFSTFGGGNQIVVISGFVTPDIDVPAPATLALLGAGLAAFGLARRRRNA